MSVQSFFLGNASRSRFRSRFSARQPRYFLLRGQKKVLKDKSAGSRFGRHRRTQCERLNGASQQATHIPLIPALIRKPSLVFALRASLSAVQICSRQICRFCRGFFVRASQPYEKRAASLPRPFGQISPKAAMLGRYARDLTACLRQLCAPRLFYFAKKNGRRTNLARWRLAPRELTISKLKHLLCRC
jgi:hypothetical protein